MTIWEVTENALSGLGVPVAASVYIPVSGSGYPDIFLVYFLVSSPALLHADNIETMRYYRMQVSVFSRNGLANLPDVDGAMLDAGFSKGAERELPYNVSTRHFCLALEYVYGNLPLDESL